MAGFLVSIVPVLQLIFPGLWGYLFAAITQLSFTSTGCLAKK
jgi:hypothetical protein